ncbi:hypothetical protein KAS50_05530, partial [bacterium]|nr:hypothetical protein [bacterium]
MNKGFNYLIVLLFSIFFIAGNPLQLHSQEKSQPFKRKLTYGFIERVRNTYFNNIIDYNDDTDDEQHFFRIRTSIWAQAHINPRLTVYAKLTNENRPYLKPDNRDWKLHEIFFDNLYFKLNFGKKTPVSLTVGRQNLIYGEGFVMLEGGPNDGSRSIYFDAVKLSVKTKDATIDFLGINNTMREDYLPIMNSEEQLLNNQKETAFGIYAVNNKYEDYRIDGYYFYKTEDSNPELKLSTFGGRIARKMKNRYAWTAEYAIQVGTQGENNHTSMGGYAYASYLLNQKPNTVFSAGINYLSGDNPDTETNDGWNPIFSRWPKWSELYIYSQIKETGKVAYWTNTISPYVKISVNPSKKLSITGTYYILMAEYPRTFTIDEDNIIVSGKKR